MILTIDTPSCPENLPRVDGEVENRLWEWGQRWDGQISSSVKGKTRSLQY